MYHFTWHEIILCLVPYFITYLLFQAQCSFGFSKPHTDFVSSSPCPGLNGGRLHDILPFQLGPTKPSDLADGHKKSHGLCQ